MPFMVQLINGASPVSDSGGTDDGQGILPIIGVADWNAPRTSDTILNLRAMQRGPNPSRQVPIFNIEAQGNDGYWMAYPKIYGLATFNEVDSNGNIIGIGDGGWDGANGDPISFQGPKEVEVVIDGKRIPMYLYMSDWPGLGNSYWRTT